MPPAQLLWQGMVLVKPQPCPHARSPQCRFHVFQLFALFGQLSHTLIISWLKDRASRETSRQEAVAQEYMCSLPREPEGSQHSRDQPGEEPIAPSLKGQCKEQGKQGAAPCEHLRPTPSSSQAVLPSVARTALAAGGERLAAGAQRVKAQPVGSPLRWAGPAVPSMAAGGEDVPRTQRRSWVPCSSCCELWLQECPDGERCTASGKKDKALPCSCSSPSYTGPGWDMGRDGAEEPCPT